MGLARLARFLAELSDLWEGGAVGNLADAWKQDRAVLGGEDGRADELEQVGNENDGLALDGRPPVVEGTSEQGHQDGQCGAVDIAHPDVGRELLDALANLVGAGHAPDEKRDERNDIRVGHDGAELFCTLDGDVGDIGLGVPHLRLDPWNVLSKPLCNLLLCP